MADWHKQAIDLKNANPRMTYDQIAAVLQKKPGTVRQFFARRKSEKAARKERAKKKPKPESEQPQEEQIESDEDVVDTDLSDYTIGPSRSFDPIPLIEVASERAIKMLRSEKTSDAIAADMIVKILNGDFTMKAMEMQGARRDEPQEINGNGKQLQLPDEVEEVILAVRRRAHDKN